MPVPVPVPVTGRRTLGRILIAGLLSLALSAAVTSPVAADPGKDRDGPLPVGVAPPTVAVVPTGAFAGVPATVDALETGCPFPAYGYVGRYICEYAVTSIDWGGGNKEYFVVGTDFSIWHIWLNSGGWHSLGGLASAFEPNGAFAFARSTPSGVKVGVWTYGTDRAKWCRDWPWTGWWYSAGCI
jgi:hypothetical protein